LLVGYSFGADIFPFALNRLPEAQQDHVQVLALLGLDTAADFEIHVAGWLGQDAGPDALPVLPEMARLDLRKVQCFYGEEEKESGCRDPAMAAAERIETPGGHHFSGDYVGLAKRILDGAERRRQSSDGR
jgi:type IV secretory pathway VirJ component